MAEMTVLLVDDEREFVEVLAKRLRKRQVALETAASGEEALARIAAAPFDVVVLDMKMPGMGGLQALDAIKRLSPGVEVIILTGHAEVDAAVEGLERGAFDYLMKPVDIDELLYRLQDAYKRKSLATRGTP